MTFTGQLQECLRNTDVIYSFEGTVINSTEKIYSFLDFKINPQQRSVTKKSEEINLSKKSFDMLVLLLKRHGELITKEELLANVWPNLIITESALNKQIARLRKTFDSLDSKQSIIETIRGVGIRFVADVKVKVEHQQNNDNNLLIKYFIVFSIFLAICFLLYKVFGQVDIKQTNGSSTYEAEAINAAKPSKKSINVAVVPAKKTDDWLNVGGLNYLSELLQQHDEIEAIKPQSTWFDTQKPDVLALQLSQTDNIDYSLIIKNLHLNEFFTAQLVLRNKHGVLSSHELKSNTLSSLFGKIDGWVVQQLNISSGVIFSNKKQQPLISDFALESYLHGVTAARNEKYIEASQYLQTAINQNQNFYSAWLLQARVQAELGNFQKSLAMCETIEKLPNFNPDLLDSLYNIKAKVLIYLNQLNDAQFYLDKSIKISNKTSDMKTLISSLSNLAILNDRNGASYSDTLEVLEKRLELIQQFQPLPLLLAESNYNLAVVNQHMHNYNKAFFYINAAISVYEKSNNKSGLFTSYRISANIHNDLAETGLALLELKKAEQWIKYVESPIILANYYMANARNLYEEGFHEKAKQAIEKLKVLSVSHSNNEPKVMALIAQAELEISYKHFERAQNTINQLLEIISTNISEYRVYSSYVASLDMYVTARFKSPKIARKKVNKYLNTYPSLKNNIEKTLRRIEAHILVSEGFHTKAIQVLDKLMQDYMQEKFYIWAIYIGYELLDVQWLDEDKKGYFKTINRVQETAHFDYPILKYRAKYYAYNKDFVNAAILMKELKPKARDFWTVEDQLLLEQYQKNIHAGPKLKSKL